MQMSDTKMILQKGLLNSKSKSAFYVPAEAKNNNGFITLFVSLALVVIVLGVLGIFFITRMAMVFSIVEKSADIQRNAQYKQIIYTRSIKNRPTIENKIEARKVEPKNLWEGTASYYSVEGCLGCSTNRTMANGETLSDDAMTIAFNHLPLNTEVKVTNPQTKESVIAKVADRGGFNSKGREMSGIVGENNLNRIADLGVAVKNSISCSDLCEVAIEEL